MVLLLTDPGNEKGRKEDFPNHKNKQKNNNNIFQIWGCINAKRYRAFRMVIQKQYLSLVGQKMDEIWL